MDIPEGIAADLDDYVAKAVALAHDPAARHAMSAQIAQRKSRLFYDDQALAALSCFLERAATAADISG